MIIPGEIYKENEAMLFFSTKEFDIKKYNKSYKFIKQIHSNKVIMVDDPEQYTADIEADALVTTLSNINLCIKTADCVPILLYDQVNDVYGAIHAGWRGAVVGVIQNTLDIMHSVGGRNSNIIARIGPCIRQESYEVSEDVYNEFLSTNSYNHIFFKKFKQSKYLFDLPGYCSYILYIAGLSLDNINDILLNTFTNPKLFFSYRYYHNNAMQLQPSDRQVSWICKNMK